MVIERADNGVGMELCLKMKIADKLAWYVIKSDGTDGWLIAFAAKECAAGEKGSRLDGATVQMLMFFYPQSKQDSETSLGYPVGEIVSHHEATHNN